MDAVKRVEAGFAVPDICRELGISTATFYKWRAKFGGMDVSMMSRMKELEEENRRLKKMYLEEKLKAEIVSEALDEVGVAPLDRTDYCSVKGVRNEPKKRGLPARISSTNGGACSPRAQTQRSGQRVWLP